MNLHPLPTGDPVTFENVATSLEAVRALLEREGHIEEARVLRGLEVLNPGDAAVALDALRSITVHSEGCADAIAFAVDVLRQALRRPSFTPPARAA
jgi:hypothetical protein